MGITQSTSYTIAIADGVPKITELYKLGDKTSHEYYIFINIIFGGLVEKELISKLTLQLNRLTYGRSFHKWRNSVQEFNPPGLKYQFQYRGPVPESLIKYCINGVLKICRDLEIFLMVDPDLYSLRGVKKPFEIEAVFDELQGIAEAPQIKQYAGLIENGLREKNSLVFGENEGWRLRYFSVKSGYELLLDNHTQYLVLHVENETESLDIKMGGDFSLSIPLISKQAESLLGQIIIWHTWNPVNQPIKWKHSEWFYMIEKA